MYFARRRARLAMARHGQRGRVIEVPRDLRPTEKTLLVATEERLLVFDDSRVRSPLIWEDRGRLRGVSSHLSESYAGEVLTIQIERHPDVAFEVSGLLFPERKAMLRAIERLVRH